LDQREKIGIVSHFANNPQAHVMYLALDDAEIRKGWLHPVLNSGSGAGHPI
jgi:hypothetical protein